MADKKLFSKKTYQLIRFLLLTAIFILSLRKIANFDIWWHLAAARYSLLNGKILTTDIFSFTNYGSNWVNSEWLAGMFYYLVYLVGGSGALVILKALNVLVIFILIFKLIEPDLRYSLTACSMAWLAFCGSYSRFTLRPHIFFYFFLLSLFYLINLSRQKNNRPLTLILFSVLGFVWANIHGSAFYSLIILGAYCVESLVRSQQKDGSPEKTQLRDYLIPGLLLFLTIALNPHGFDIYFYPFRAFSHDFQLSYITEYDAINKLDLLGPLGVFLLLTPYLLYQLIRKKQYANLLILLFFAYTAYRYGRFIAVFFLAAAPIYTNNLPKWRWAEKPLRSILLFSAVLAIGLLPLRKNIFTADSLGLDFDWRRFPRKATEFIRANLSGKQGGNEYGWGGYLIWALPEKKVFIDGRFADRDLFRDYIAMTGSAAELIKLANQYRLDYMLISKINAPDRKKLALLFTKANWGLIYRDDKSYLFLKRGPANKSLLRRFEYRLYDLEFRPGMLGELIKNTGNRRRLESEIKRAYRGDKKDQRIAVDLGNLYQLTNNWTAALTHWREFTRKNPQTSGGWYRLGFTKETLGDRSGAEISYKKALKLQPDLKSVRKRLQTLSLRAD